MLLPRLPSFFYFANWSDGYAKKDKKERKRREKRTEKKKEMKQGINNGVGEVGRIRKERKK